MDSNTFWLVAVAILLLLAWPKAESFKEPRKRKAAARRGTRNSTSFRAEIPGIMLNARVLKSMGLPVKVRGHFLSLLKAKNVCSRSPDCIGYVRTTWKDKNPRGGPVEYYSLIRATKPGQVLAVVNDMAKTNEVMRVGEMRSRTFQLFLKEK